MNVAPKHMALDCVFRLLHSLHHTDRRQDFFCKRNQQTTEQAKNTLRSLRRVVRLHGHTELHNAPAEDDTTLNNIIVSIAKSVSTAKQLTLNEMLNAGQINNARTYITNNLDKDLYNGYFEPACFEDSSTSVSKEFTKVLEIQANTWASKMFSYLKSCISQINLSQISLEESQRARAIDIYENLNRGGVSLDIFDLIMARVAQATPEPFYQRLEKCVSSGSGYPAANISSAAVKKAFQAVSAQGNYHASESMQCYNSDKNEFPKVYLETFLNILSLICYNGCRGCYILFAESDERHRR